MLNEIEKYRSSIRLYLTSLGALAALGFSLLQYFNQQHTVSFLALMCAIHFAAVVYILVKEKRYLWQGRGYAIVLSFSLLHVIANHPEYGIFWAYVMITYIFVLMNIKEALIVSIIFTLLTFYFVSSFFSTPVLIRVYATITLVWMFGFLYSFLIEKLLTKVNSLVTQDPLTNALNRHAFHTSIDNALSASHRYKTPASLFIFDLDFFKKINDSYGHQVGDRILKSVSAVVQNRLRDTDQLFRYGGEEFAVLLAHTDQTQAFQLADEIRKLVKSENYVLPEQITISGGVSQVNGSDDVSSWIERADKALYKAKNSGRNKIIVFENN